MIKNIYVMIGAESIQFKKPFLKKSLQKLLKSKCFKVIPKKDKKPVQPCFFWTLINFTPVHGLISPKLHQLENPNFAWYFDLHLATFSQSLLSDLQMV